MLVILSGPSDVVPFYNPFGEDNARLWGLLQDLIKTPGGLRSRQHPAKVFRVTGCCVF